MKIASKLLFLAVCGVACSVQAAPVGPSAKMAAQLKKRPTSAWLAHYLPDDRYKIAGGIWKYVSTDLDTYYHRPDSPNILRQPADRVIGFASAADAEAAGYRPDGSVYNTAPLGVAPIIPIGRRYFLSDQVSTLVLPANWKKVHSDVENFNGGIFASDAFEGSKGQRLLVMIYTSPLNIDFARVVSPEQLSSLGSSLTQFDRISQSSGRVDSQIANATSQLKKATTQRKITGVVSNGLRGSKVVVKSEAQKGDSANVYVFGRGRKIYFMADYLTRPTDSAKLLRAVQFK